MTMEKNKKVRDVKTTDTVLALGEVSGHRHVLKNVQVLAEEDGLATRVVVPENTVVVHEEHDTASVLNGRYDVRIQERVNVLGEIRKVMD